MADDLSTRIQVDGLNHLLRSLRRLDSEMPKKLRNIHRQVATPVAERARAIAPKRTGRLSRSIRPLGSQKVARVAAGGVAVPYAGPIHYGWPARNIKAQPFLTDAVYQMLPATLINYKMMLESEMREGWESIS